MNANKNFARLVEELAGHWTEPVLEILDAAEVRGDSLRMELDVWHTLQDVLRAELRWQRVYRISGQMSLCNVMEQVLRQATLLVAQRYEPQAVSGAFQRRLPRSTQYRRPTHAERRVFAKMVHQLPLHDAFQSPSRTDFVPRLRDLVMQN